MTKCYLLILALFAFTASFAIPKKFAATNDNWVKDNSWNPIGKPGNNDNIVIPAGSTVIASGNDFPANKLSLNNVTIDVYGTLQLADQIQVLLDNSSKIIVHTGGKISGASNSEKISLNGWVYTGGAGSIVGPQMAQASPSGFAAYVEPIVLPVKFIGFNVSVSSGSNLVQWATAEEENALNYEVERSNDGSSWSTIGTVAAVGNTTLVSNYSFADKNSTATVVYYRIKQVDVDGKFTYTAIKSVKRGDAATVAIAASNSNVAINFSKQVKEKVELQIVNFSGQVVAKQILNEPFGQVIVTPQANIKGNYIVLVSSNSLKVARQVSL